MSTPIPDAEYEAILDLIAGGMTLSDAIRAQGGRPTASAFLARCRQDPEFSRAYFFAKQARAEERQAKFVSVLQKVENRALDPQSGRVILDSLRYLMAADDTRMAEKTRAEISGPDGRPLIEPRNQSPLDDMEVARFLAFTLDRQSRQPILLEALSTS